jgi:hypothetical protein
MLKACHASTSPVWRCNQPREGRPLGPVVRLLAVTALLVAVFAVVCPAQLSNFQDSRAGSHSACG